MCFLRVLNQLLKPVAAAKCPRVPLSSTTLEFGMAAWISYAAVNIKPVQSIKHSYIIYLAKDPSLEKFDKKCRSTFSGK